MQMHYKILSNRYTCKYYYNIFLILLLKPTNSSGSCSTNRFSISNFEDQFRFYVSFTLSFVNSLVLIKLYYIAIFIPRLLSHFISFCLFLLYRRVSVYFYCISFTQFLDRISSTGLSGCCHSVSRLCHSDRPYCSCNWLRSLRRLTDYNAQRVSLFVASTNYRY